MMKEKIKNRMWNKNKLLSIGLLIALFIFVDKSFTYASEEDQPVRVGYYEMNGFFERDEEGNLFGYGIEYYQKIHEISGLDFVYIEADSWAEAYGLMKEGRLDILAPTQKSVERVKEFGFCSHPIGLEYGGLFGREDEENLSFEDFGAFSTLRIGSVDNLGFGENFQQYAKKNSFNAEIITYSSNEEVMKALRSGKIDAVVSNMMIKEEDMKLLGKFSIEPFYFMYQKDNTILGDKLNAAMSKIRMTYPTFEYDLIKKYYPFYDDIPFTKQEELFLQGMPKLKVGCTSNSRPLSFQEEKTGEVTGITRDIMEKIGRISGLQFEYVPLPTHNISYEYLQEQGIDLVTGVEDNRFNAQGKRFSITDPYMTSQKVIIGRKSESFEENSSLKIALVTSSQTFPRIIAEKYPAFSIQVYETTEEAMKAVNAHKADVLMMNQYEVEYYFTKPVYENLTVLPAEGLKEQSCIGVLLLQGKGEEFNRKLSDERLISILNKSIAKISDEDRSGFFIHYTLENNKQYNIWGVLYRYRYLLAGVGIVVLCIMILILYTDYMRRCHIRMISENENKLNNITDNISGGVLVLKPEENFKITFANAGFLDLIKCEQEKYPAILNSCYENYVVAEDMEELRRQVRVNGGGSKKISMQLKMQRMDGKCITALFKGTLGGEKDSSPELYCVIMDVTEQVNILNQLESEQERYELLLEKSDDIVFEIDLEKQDIIMSTRFQEKFGWTFPPKLPNHSIYEIMELWKVHEEDKARLLEAECRAMVDMEESKCVVRLLKEDGSYLWCRVLHYITQNLENSAVTVIGKVVDIDDEVKEKMLLREKAQKDPLTQLYNKATFLSISRKYLDKYKNSAAAVIFIDLDNFKQVNDTFGHLVGDEALKKAAENLERIFNRGEILARFGGDEFCVLVKEMQKEELEGRLEQLVVSMQEAYENQVEKVLITSSIGVAYRPDHGKRLSVLLECADRALYAAKENGKNQYTVYGCEVRVEKNTTL